MRNYNWKGAGTFEYRDKAKNLIIIDKYSSPFTKEVSFDVNIFENENDESFFNEISVAPKRLKAILDFYEFDKNIIDEIL